MQALEVPEAGDSSSILTYESAKFLAAENFSCQCAGLRVRQRAAVRLVARKPHFAIGFKHSGEIGSEKALASGTRAPVIGFKLAAHVLENLRQGRRAMDLFRTKKHSHLVPIHPENTKSRDWVILLEASTIVGPSPDQLRVASTTQEKKIVWRFKGLRLQPFLVVEGYDPRIHVLYFCPQLYKFESDSKLVPLPGEEIGRFVAQAVEGKVKSRRPWYEPLDELPTERIITAGEVDTLVVERPPGRPGLASAAAGPRAVG